VVVPVFAVKFAQGWRTIGNLQVAREVVFLAAAVVIVVTGSEKCLTGVVALHESTCVAIFVAMTVGQVTGAMLIVNGTAAEGREEARVIVESAIFANTHSNDDNCYPVSAWAEFARWAGLVVGGAHYAQT